MLYPMVLVPAYKEYLWGGRKLKEKYHKDCAFETVAESWELSTHRDGISNIANGKYAGKSFLEYLRAEGSGVLGTRAGGRTDLPVLIKYIDAADSLSIQVHPDDDYARKTEGSEGKTEFWYVMDCGRDAALYYGFREGGISKEEFIRRAQDGTVTDVLNRVPVHKGDTFVIEAGTVHAIGKNMTVAEIGTNCNITYRIYDFGRTDAQGNPRPLHIEKAADVFRKDAANKKWKNGKIDCGAFCVEKVCVDGEQTRYADPASFQCLMCVEGHGMVEGIELPAGMSLFLPAGMGEYTLKGKATVLAVTI